MGETIQVIEDFKTLTLRMYLYSLPNIVRVVKSRRMRWAGHVARRGGEKCAQGFGGET
jgi:hypothetical protein